MNEELGKKGILLYRQGMAEKAMPLLLRALALEPNNHRILAYLGLSLAKVNKLEEGLVKIEKAISKDPQNAWIHRCRAWILRTLERNEEALESTLESIRIEPNALYSQISHSRTLENLKRYQEALIAANRAIAIDPESADAWDRCGWAYYRNDENEKARDCFYEASRLDPSIGMFGVAFMASNVESIEMYRRVLELDPNETIAQGNMALRLSRMGRWEEAYDVARFHLAADPQSTLGLEVYVRSAVNSGRLKEAIGMSDRLREFAVEREGKLDEYRVYEGLGHLALAQKQYDLARKHYKKALHLKDWCCLTIGVGRAAFACGDIKEAQEMYERAIKKNPCESACSLLQMLKADLGIKTA